MALRRKQWVYLVLIALNLAAVLVGQLMLSFRIDFQHPQKHGTTSTFQYNLWRGAWELWKNDLRALACLLFVFSGLWPYVKLLALGYVVVAEQLPCSRGHLLQWLGVLGKWSFIDICIVVNVILALSFRYKVMLIFEGWAQGVALDGAFVYCSAIMASQTIGALLPHHSLSANDGTDGTPHPAPHALSTAPTSAGRAHACYRHPGHVWCLLLVTLVALALGIASQTTTMLEIEYKYTILGSQFDIARKEYSLVQGWKEISSNARLNRWNHLLSLYGFVFITVLPVLQTILCLPLWYVLLKQPQNTQVVAKLRQRVSDWGGWAIHDVNLLGLVVMICEIGNIGKHLAKDLSIEVSPREGLYLMGLSLVAERVCIWYTANIHKSYILDSFDDEEAESLLTDSNTPGQERFNNHPV